MKILAIETSCDETACCVLSYGADQSLDGFTVTDGASTEYATNIINNSNTITIEGNALWSQIDLHAPFGGVFPALAKRAHAEKSVPLLTACLEEAGLLIKQDSEQSRYKMHADAIATFLAPLQEKESALIEVLLPFFKNYQAPDIDAIAVTNGPGLAPALWVGVNFAKALTQVWSLYKGVTIPVIPINHMEGHVVTAMYVPVAVGTVHTTKKQYQKTTLALPAIALLVSGGHTELVLMEDIGSYKKIGQTVDDAIGEAFDKVARMLGLAYPGGPKVSQLAAEYRAHITQTSEQENTPSLTLPRPMMHSGDYNFSYSGIKTATLYAIRDMTNGNSRPLTDDEKMMIACAFEDAAIEVVAHKAIRACQEYHAGTLIVGGGVAGNSYLQSQLITNAAKKIPHCTVLFPERWLATDNAIMIGLAACGQLIAGTAKTPPLESIAADGNLSL